MILTIYKSSKSATASPVANVEIEGNEIKIRSDDKQLVRIIKSILILPVKIKDRGKNSVTKRKPSDIEEHSRNSLVEKLHSPYWIGPKEMILEDPKYEEVMGTLEIEPLLA